MPRRSRSPDKSRGRRRRRERSSSGSSTSSSESSGARRRRRDQKRKGSRGRSRSRRSDRRRRSRSPKDPRKKAKSRSRSLSWSPPPAVRRQMAAAKLEAEKRAAGAAVKVFDGYRFVEVDSENEGTLAKRRLMLQNLPPEITEETCKAFLNAMLRECGAITGDTDAVTNCWVSKVSQMDKKGTVHDRPFKFGFVEMATVESAATAIALNGINCMGNNIKIMLRSVDSIIGTCAGGVILPGLTPEEFAAQSTHAQAYSGNPPQGMNQAMMMMPQQMPPPGAPPYP